MKKHRKSLESRVRKVRQQLQVELLEPRNLCAVAPYVQPVAAGVQTTALLTVGDAVSGYRMAGIPDGLGAFDNGDGTFTLLMNHELGSTVGTTRTHGSKGAFVSKWTIDKSTLQVLSGQDLIQTVVLDGSSSTAFNRFCSADLPDVTAYFDAASGLGTTDRIFMNGEESTGGRAFGHVVTGAMAGTSYELKKLGAFAHENVVANPFAQVKTIVAGTDDTTPSSTNGGGKIYIYIGNKTNSGTPVDRAGLTNGINFAVQVTGVSGETRTSGLAASGNLVVSGAFTLVDPASGGTQFLRPEDGAWDPVNPSDFYFVTTDQLDLVQDGLGAQVGRSRLWRLHFSDLMNPQAGGTVEMLVDGTEGGNMFDNLTIDSQGRILLQEDVGNAAHNGKIWSYDRVNDRLFAIAKHDSTRFGDAGVPATAPFNQDEESSGIIDVSSILGAGRYLFDVQAHYAINSSSPNGFTNPDELVEGGQLDLLTIAPSVSFLGVGAGDATSDSAVLWTRAQDISSSAGVGVIAQVSADSTFATGLATFAGTTDPAHDWTIHVGATGLQSGTRYFYRFVATGGTTSPVGTFVTAPSPTANVPVSFGFTGDADGLMRPYDATNSPNFAAPGAPGFGTQNFDYFVWLGDTIYETKSGDATPNSSPSVDLATPRATEYWRKYREQFLPVTTGSYAGLSDFYRSSGHYTLLDNHELGNRQYINGGAPANAPSNTTDPSFDVNTSGTYMHNTPGFKTLEQAYTDYQPIRVEKVVAPNDPRSDGTQKLYNAQPWGASSVFINLDDRTNRDIRLRNSSGDDTGVRADNPNRTMLGATELQWFQQQLLAAQAAGVNWKIVAVSSPIDQTAPIGGSFSVTNGVGNTANTYATSISDGGKSWIGGYRAERNALLKFIADNRIDHVVFMSTDDHQLRINELGYFTQFDSNGTPIQSSYVRVPGAMSIVAGPIGATGPDLLTDHSFTNIQTLAQNVYNQQSTLGIDPVGLDPAFPGLKNVTREGDATANATRSSVDFFSPDTFNYAALNVSADGTTLSVAIKGVNSYATNSFPQPSGANPVRDILSFQIGLQPSSLAVSQASATVGGATTLVATLTDGATGLPMTGKAVTFKLGATQVGTATTNASGVATLLVDAANYAPGSYSGEVQATFAGDAGAIDVRSSATLIVTPNYLMPLNQGVGITPLLSVGDSAAQTPQYRMVGIPDGLGAYDNGNGTFTVLMNQELTASQGAQRAHGGTGAFVSKWVFDKTTLAPLSGADLMQTVKSGADFSSLTGTALNFSRFCSADLPATSAFYNATTGNGTRTRILLNGEETGGGRAMAHVVDGPEAGVSYTLPAFGGRAWENLLANPGSGDTTLVMANEDGSIGTSRLISYVGTKQNTGNEIQRAGLTNGTAYQVQVAVGGVNVAAESRVNGLGTTTPAYKGTFSLVAGTGTGFNRAEDGVWDPSNPRDYYFVTTDQAAIGNRNSRLWKLSFSDLSNPLAGGTIEVLINGKDTAVMFDNITMDKNGRLVLQEDVGNDARLGQIWMYDTTSGALVPLAQHRPEFFLSGNSPSQFLTQDEESSGVIDVSNILGEGAFLLDVQAHYGISTATSRGFDNPNQLVEGGQLVLMRVGALAANGYLANDSTGPTDLASNSSVVVLGTNGADTFSVTPGSNGWFDVTGKAGSLANGGFAPPAGYFIVNGYGGNDWIDLSRVPSTPSRLYGGDGIDSIRGTDARDRIYGGAGIDNLYGNAGDDDLFGGDGIDYLFGGAGADRLQGDAGVDLFMYDAFDTLVDYVLGRDAKIRWF